MSAKNVEFIINQVKWKLEAAKMFYQAEMYEQADRELSLLRDVLDDIYDRPEEDVTEESSGVQE